MMRRIFIGSFVAGCVLFSDAAPPVTRIDLKADALAARARAEGVDSVIVVLKEDAPRKKSGALDFSFKKVEVPTRILKEQKKNGKSKAGRKKPKHLANMHKAKLKKGADIGAALKELNESPLVEYAEPNWRVQTCAVPNDSHYGKMTPLHNTGQQTFEILSGPSLGWVNGLEDADMDWQEAWTNQVDPFPTQEVIVAVIDTGVDYTHLDITNQMWRNLAELNGTPGVDDDGNGYVDDIFGYDFYNTDADPIDLQSEGGSHGTHVAGTIAAEADNNYGTVGVNPHARIMAIKFLGEDGGNTDDAIEAVIYAVDNGAKILNNSWGGGAWQQAMQDAVDYAVTNGVVFVAASGNSDSGSPFYPATYSGVISVNSMDWNDEKADYSNYGWFTDVSAHGSDILSLKCADYSDDGLVFDNDFVVYHGTSMACPQTAGALALLYAKHPGLHPYLYEQVLKTTCDTEMLSNDVNKDYEGELGAGRINVNRLLNENIDTGFLRVMWAETTTLAVPGNSYVVSVDAGIWTNDHTDVSIVATNLTEGISLGNWSYNLGSMTGLTTITIPTNAFVATIDAATTNSKETLSFELWADGKVLATQRLSVSFVNGNALHLLVDDFNADGTNEIATAYYEYTMLYDHTGELQWIAESTLGMGNWTFNVASADLTGNGRKEIVATEHKWIFSSGDPGLFVFDCEGSLLDGFPVVLEDDNDDQRRGFGEPALVDLDEDGSCEIVCNLEFDDGSSVIRVYDADASVLWEKELELTETGPPSAGDLDGDGFEELVAWNYDFGDGAMPRSRIYVLDGDGTELASWAMDMGYSSEQKDLHFPDNAKPVLGDLDGDGDLEIILYAIGLEEGLFAYHHDGTPVDGWPIALPDQWASSYSPVELMDADGDGDVEVFTRFHIWDGAETYEQIFVFNGDGTLRSGFPTAQENDWGSRFVMDDVTGDGAPEVLIPDVSGTDDKSGFFLLGMDGNGVPGYNPFVIPGVEFEGVTDVVLTQLGFNNNRHVVMSLGYEVFIVDTSNTLNNLELAWPMKHQNPRRTGACVARTNIPYRCSFSGDVLAGISNLTVNFTGYAMEFDPENSWFSWDYDNEGTPDHQAFGVSTSSYAYTSTGIYDVSLTVSNAAGESFTRTRSNYVHVLPPVAAGFSAIITTGSAPVEVRFTDLSQNNPQSWAWDFDDDGSIDSTEQNPVFYYTGQGSYTVSLTVSNHFGVWGTSSDIETKTSYIVLTNTASTDIKYVSTNGLHLFPFKNWNEAATNVQDAIDAANDNETVLIGDGEYIAGDGESLMFSVESVLFDTRDNLTIKSLNGPEKTIIKGWGHYPPQRGFYVYNTDDVSIEGFTIRDMYSNGGGGVLFDIQTGTPTVKNCWFINNTEYTPANGASCINVWNEGVLIQDCKFINNSSRSGAVQLRTSEGFTATVENCEFRGNSGDSYITAAAILIDNRSYSPAFPGAVGEHLIRNCLFTENTGWYSVVYSQPGLTMENCTFADNTVLASGGAVLRSALETWHELEGTNQGPWTVRNTVLSDNWAESEFSDQIASPMNFSYSCMTSAVAGIGNIQTNDPGLSGIPGEAHLAFGSPCIDAGTNLSWMGSANDLLDGDPRILNGTVDIGADEYSMGCRVEAVPQAGTSTLHVVFSGFASSLSGSITNWSWSFGDGSPAEEGASQTNASHSYTAEGDYTAILRVQDDAGNSASNGIVITVDDTGPVLEAGAAPFETTVIVTYNEAVSAATATNLANYAMDTVSIYNIVMTAADEVTLTVSPMTDLATNRLTVSGIRDIYGNLMSGIQTQQVVYIDAYGDNRLLIDFGGFSFPTTNVGWNNLTQPNKTLSGSAITNMVNARGGDTAVDVKLLDSFDQVYTTESGPVVTNILYPVTAQQDVMNHNNSGPVSFRLSDLDVSNTYDLIFFAGSGYVSDYSTRYGVGLRLTEIFQAYNNTSNTVSLLEVSPDANGWIDVDVYNEGDAAAIGVLEIRPRLPMIEISTNQVSVPEGSTAQFLVRLLEDPVKAATVTVSRLSGDTNLSVNAGDELIFTHDNWSEWQQVQLLATEDDDSENGSAVFQCANAGYSTRTLTAVEVENDIAVTVSSSTVYVPENSGNRFDVFLTAEPVGAITVSVSHVSGDADISIVQGTNFVFTSNDWNIGQTVVLAAQTDGDTLDGTALIQCAAPAVGSTVDVTAVEIDTARTGFTAYHDMDNDGTRNALDHSNVTHGYTHGTVYPLNDLDSGSSQSAGIVFRYYNDFGAAPSALTISTPLMPNPAAYQDAYRVFNGIIDAATSYKMLKADNNEYGVITFTNLIPNAIYDVALYMNNDGLNAQQTVFTLQGAETFTPAMSAGVGDAGDSDDATFEHDADNTETGYIVGWDEITLPAGADSFSVKASIYLADTTGFIPQAIRLIERLDSTHHVQQVLVSTNRVVIPEATYQTFQARLATQPSGATTVTVTKAIGDENIIVSEGEILVYSLADWDQWQTVTLWGGSDADNIDGEAAIHCVVGSSTTVVTVVEDDDEAETSGPVILGAVAPAATTVRITFDEEVDLATAQTAGNYSIDQGISISSAVRDASDNSLVTLTVSTMVPGTYRLTVNNVEDTNSNAIVPNSGINVIYSGLIGFYTNALDVDPQWPATGLWEFGVPLGGGGSGADIYSILDPDPTSGFTGTNVYGYNLAGDYPHDDGDETFYLTSDAIDCSDYESVQLSFQRWLNVHGYRNGLSGNATLDASADGQAWTEIWGSDPDELSATSWTNVSYDVSSVADGASTFYLRWGMSYVYYQASGWNIDDILLEGVFVGEPASGIELSTESLSVPEGGANTFDIRLYGAPENAVTVTVAQVGGDSDIQLQGISSFVFNTNDWDQWQTATLQAATDADWVAGVATVRCSAAGMDSITLVATETDSDENPDYTLPFEEPFEVLTAGALAGQHGWTGGGTVQGDTALDTQALALTHETALHTFTDAATNVWLSFWMQPVLSEAAPDSIDADSTAVFYALTNGHLVAYSNTTPIELSATVSNGWNKVEIFCDYGSKVWNLSLNDTVAATNLGFYSDPAAFASIKFVESSTNVLYIDDINITDNLIDSDNDGLPDDWEDDWFGDLDASPGDLAANPDYTVWQCYIAGISPVDSDADFLISDLHPLTSESILYWQNASGRVYTIYWTSNLLNGFDGFLTNNYTGGTFTDTVHGADEKGFYKIDVQLEE